MTKYENNATSEFTVYVDPDTAYMIDLEWSIIARDSRYSKTLRVLQYVVAIVWGIAFMRTWLAAMCAIQ
jgi:hypothetical protein